MQEEPPVAADKGKENESLKPLSEKMLAASVTESYQHGELDDATDAEREQKREAILEAKRKAA